MIDNDINKILNRLSYILANEDHEPLNVIGNHIVGMIGALENIEIIYAHYPLLEIIANRGAELNITADEARAKVLINNIQEHLDQLKKSVRVSF